MQSKKHVIVFTDIKDFTKKTSNMTSEQLKVFMNNHDIIMHPIVKKFKGVIVKTIGDALLLTFKSSNMALYCAMNMQKSVYEFNKNAGDDEKFQIRIAIDYGSVQFKNRDVFGTTVNLASRVEKATPAGEIYFTDNFRLSLGINKLPISFVNKYEFKGIKDIISIYKIDQDFNSNKYIDLLGEIDLSDNFVKDSFKRSSGAGTVRKTPIKPVLPKNKFNDNRPGFLKQNFLQVMLLFVFIIITGVIGFLYFNNRPANLLEKIAKNINTDKEYIAVVSYKKLEKYYSFSEEYKVARELFEEKNIKEMINNKKFDQVEEYIEKAVISDSKKEELLKKNIYSKAVYFLQMGHYSVAKEICRDYINEYGEDEKINSLILKAESMEDTGSENVSEEIKPVIENKKTDVIKKSEDLFESPEIDELNENLPDEIDEKIEIPDNANKSEKIEKKVIFSVNYKKRTLQYKRLKENNELSKKIIIQFYISNLENLTPGDEQSLEKTLKFFKRLESGNEKSTLIEVLREHPVKYLKSLEFWSDVSMKVCEYIIESDIFSDMQFLMSGINQRENLSNRYYSFYILNSKEYLNADIINSFHKENIEDLEIKKDVRPFSALIRLSIDEYVLKDENSENIKSNLKNRLEDIIKDVYNRNIFFHKEYIKEVESIVQEL